MRSAVAGAFADVLVTTLVVTVVLMLSGADPPALTVLVGVTGLSAVDAGLRYLAIHYRALR